MKVTGWRDVIHPLELGIHSRYQINALFAVKAGGGWRFVFPVEVRNIKGYYLKLTAVVNPKRLSDMIKEKRQTKDQE